VKHRVPGFSLDVTVDIDPEDLHAAGWHHDSELDLDWCPEDAEPAPLSDAVASLHRQAHPGQHPSVTMGHEEPCRSLSIDQLRGAVA
jgi:hypothetical protein